jgi:hypothetical protein
MKEPSEPLEKMNRSGFAGKPVRRREWIVQ